MDPADAGIDRGARSRAPRPSRCSGCRSRRSDRSSAGSPAACRRIAIPQFRADLILPLLPSALTVALLAAVESLLSAVVADSMTGDRHNSNAELLAQGVANLVVPLVGGIPVTGAIARTATNFRSGARTPVAGMVHALTLLVDRPARWRRSPIHVPLATLAAVLFVVAYNMGEWREIGGIWRLDWTDKSVWLITFALTVMADLTIAVEVGHGARRAPLHLSRHRDDERLDGHPRVHRGRARARAAGQGRARPTSRSCASTGRSCSG